MPRIKCSPETEVIGLLVRSYTDNLQADQIAPLLEKYGLTEIRPDRWYSLKPWLDVIDELSAQPDFTENMIAIGMRVAEYAALPPGTTLGQVLEGWNAYFHANHRHGEIGHVVTEKVHETFYRTIHRTIYPDDFNYGLIYGFARALLPEDADFEVWYEDFDHRLDHGNSDETVICVRWWEPPA